MGCWNETCALTHTPILAGEECYMVIVHRASAMKDYWQLEFPIFAWQGTFKGHYNDYGWLDEVDQEKYNYDKLLRIFVCKEAAEYAIEKYRSEVEKSYRYVDALEMTKLLADIKAEKKIEYKELNPLYIETMCFVYLGHMNRMNLFGASTSQMVTESFEFAKDLWEIARRRYETFVAEEAADRAKWEATE